MPSRASRGRHQPTRQSTRRPARVTVSAAPGRVRSGIHFFTTRRPRSNRVIAWLRARFAALRARRQAYLARRPHRLLRLTRRRDIPRAPQLPGYLVLTHQVWRVIGANRWTYLLLVLLYAALSAALVGFVQQQTYHDLSDSLKAVGPQIIQGDADALLRSTALFVTAVTGSLTTEMDGVQQLYLIVFFLLTWLSVVWFLRQRLAGHSVRLRDALYQGGAPVVSSAVLVLVGIVQCLPLIIGLIVYGALNELEITSAGFMAMMGGLGLGLLALISLYFLASTFLALIVVTIPGTYPFAALRTAGDIALGRRLPLTLRLVWLLAVLCLVWLVVLLPVILLGDALPDSLAWLPLVPLTIQLLASLSVVFGATYTYILYRRMIDEPAAR